MLDIHNDLIVLALVLFEPYYPSSAIHSARCDQDLTHIALW